MRLGPSQSAELCVAALLHDVATPPFAHTAEFVLDGFDHAEEAFSLFNEIESATTPLSYPVYAGHSSQFPRVCSQVSRAFDLELRPDVISRMIVGDGPLGHLIASYADLDNIDNVTRASMLLGLPVDPSIPPELARQLGSRDGPFQPRDAQPGTPLGVWESYRNRLYGVFFLASTHELERQSWLQTLMRRALAGGLPTSRLVWNTDDGLLNDLNAIFANDELALNALNAYRLMRPSRLIAEVAIESHQDAQSLARPGVAAWLERELSGKDGLVSVLTTRRRVEVPDVLIQPPHGYLRVFASESSPDAFIDRRLEMLAETGVAIPKQHGGAAALSASMGYWIDRERVNLLSMPAKTSIAETLAAVKDWSFRSDRNESFVPYPGTWVHSLPATLLRCLDLRGRDVVDPFGGTGQTAIEGMRFGVRVDSIDSNSVACLVARARTSFLGQDSRSELVELAECKASGSAVDPENEPMFDELSRWFHESTLLQLLELRDLCEASASQPVRDFSLATFAGILDFCSSRRGKSQSYFADNTPTGKSGPAAPNVDAAAVFRRRMVQNLRWYDRLVSQIGRNAVDVEQAFDRATIVQGDSLSDSILSTAEQYDSIVTSPPYLGVLDYALGQRLPYYFLFPEQLAPEAAVEIGTRRARKRRTAIPDYIDAMTVFAKKAHSALRPGGMIALVVGSSTGKAFADVEPAQLVLDCMADAGLTEVWTAERPIVGHRIHNFRRVRRERIAVLVK